VSDKKTITAIFGDKNSAIRALDYLRGKGARIKNMSALSSEKAVVEAIELEEHIVELTGKSVMTGAAIGASTLSVLALVATSLNGSSAILSSSPLIILLAAAFAGAAAGGLIGGIIGAGIPEVETRLIEEKLEEGNIMIGLKVKPSNVKKFKNLLENTKAESVAVY